MHGRTAGVVGTGKIGQCVCSILKGFGCELLMYNRTKRPELEEKFDAAFVEMDEIIEKCDIISLHVPLTPETHYIINKESISRMKDGVMIINTGRGPLIDTKALLEGLKTGKVGFAGLDVYEEESAYFFEDYSEELMTDDTLARLTTFNNVIVTSHQAFLTEDALSNIAETTLHNINQFRSGMKGSELANAVTSNQ
jgi:D-lactate dehydrogenase